MLEALVIYEFYTKPRYWLKGIIEIPAAAEVPLLHSLARVVWNNTGIGRVCVNEFSCYIDYHIPVQSIWWPQLVLLETLKPPASYNTPSFAERSIGVIWDLVSDNINNAFYLVNQFYLLYPGCKSKPSIIVTGALKHYKDGRVTCYNQFREGCGTPR